MFILHCRKGKAESSTPALILPCRYIPAMGFNNTFGDRQADPHTAGLCGHEGLEQLRGDLVGNARNLNAHPAVRVQTRLHEQFDADSVARAKLPQRGS